MNKRSALYVLFLTAFAGVGLTRQAHACQCGAKPPADVAVGQSDVVIAGVVTAVDQAAPNPAAGALPPVSRVRIKVQKRWKGAAVSELTLTQASTCAYSFQLGRAYLVFAGSHGSPNGNVEASKCLPNKPYAQAAPELALLGAPSSNK
jgi:hypothetical protein